MMELHVGRREGKGNRGNLVKDEEKNEKNK